MASEQADGGSDQELNRPVSRETPLPILGDPGKADEARIPDFHWNDDVEWTPTGGHFDIKCDYQLLVDNLLDLSHEAFVHPTTIGNVAIAEAPVRTETEGEAVRVQRQINGHPPPPLYVKLKGFKDDIDRTQNIEWTPPSNIVINGCDATQRIDALGLLAGGIVRETVPLTAGIAHCTCPTSRVVHRGCAVADRVNFSDILSSDIVHRATDIAVSISDRGLLTNGVIRESRTVSQTVDGRIDSPRRIVHGR